MPPPTAVLQRRAIVANDGTHLSVLLATPPAGTPVADLPPVLAVHGFASSARSGWGRTGHLDALARAGRIVIAPDLRGHGLSGRPHRVDAYTLPMMLADLVAVARQLVNGVPQPPVTGPLAAADTGPIDLLGYSLGARLCWALARGHLLPVRRMVLGGFDGRPLFQGVDAERLDRLAAGVPGNDPVALRYLVAGLAGTGRTPPGGPLPDVPILLVAGAADPLATDARHLAERLPHGSLLPIKGRDHISAVPAAAFRRGVVEFLTGPDGASGVWAADRAHPGPGR